MMTLTPPRTVIDCALPPGRDGGSRPRRQDCVPVVGLRADVRSAGAGVWSTGPDAGAAYGPRGPTRGAPQRPRR